METKTLFGYSEGDIKRQIKDLGNDWKVKTMDSRGGTRALPWVAVIFRA